MVDPDLQLIGVVIQTKGGSLKRIFLPHRASVWSKNKGGPRPPWPLPWISHCTFGCHPWIQILLHRGAGGGWMEPLPGVSDKLQYFEAILP